MSQRLPAAVTRVASWLERLTVGYDNTVSALCLFLPAALWLAAVTGVDAAQKLSMVHPPETGYNAAVIAGLSVAGAAVTVCKMPGARRAARLAQSRAESGPTHPQVPHLG